MMSASLLVLMALAGCGDKDDTFGSGGTSATDDDDGGSDTGEADTGGTVDDGASPEINEITAEFYTPPNFDTVIEVYVFWQDDQADVDGGKVFLDVLASDGESFSTTLDIDGPDARIDDTVDGDPVWFWISGEDGGGINTGRTYDLTIQLQDSAGNRSAAVVASVE